MKRKYNDQERSVIELIGKNFKLIRRAKGQTREEIATFFGCSSQQIAKYEEGKDRISAAKLFMYSEKYNIPIVRFISQDSFALKKYSDFETVSLPNIDHKKNKNVQYYDLVNKFIDSLHNIDPNQN